jgi:hypothetical protein
VCSPGTNSFVDLISFALQVVPPVRHRLMELGSQAMMQQFFHFDVD